MTEEYLQAVEHDSHLNLPERLHIDPKTMATLRVVEEVVEAACAIINMLTPKPKFPTGGIRTRDGEIIVPKRLLDNIEKDGLYSAMMKQRTKDMNTWTKYRRTHGKICNQADNISLVNFPHHDHTN